MLSATHTRPASLRHSWPATERGFTLLELMTTIMVAAVLAALSIPMYSSYVRNQRVKTATYDLVYTLTLARGEALKRNAPVVVQANADGWQFGWSVVTTDATPLTLHSHETPTFLDSNGDPTSYVTFTPDDDNDVTYNGSGRLTAPVVTFRIASASGTTTEIPPRCVTIDLSGMPRSTLSTAGACP
jgi:type IV fimbrial biogenesis protein FimT